MRILHVTSSMDARIGGPPAVLRALTPVISALGHSTEFATCEAPLGQVTEQLLDCPIHRLGPPRFGYQYASNLPAWLRKHAQNFDAVFIHGLWQHHGVSTRRALLGTGVPYFVYPHGMLDPWFKTTYPLKHIKKLLYWNLAERKVLSDAAAVLFTCEEERRLASQSFPFYACTERVVEFGTARPLIDASSAKSAFFKAFPLLKKGPSLLFMSRIHPKKGVDLLLMAYGELRKRNPNSLPDLVIAGPCEDSAYLQSLKKIGESCCPANSVHWTGMIEGEIKWGALLNCEAFVLPSHQENFGIAVAEAMAVGRPVIISDKVNIWREIVSDGGGMANADTLDGTLQSLKTWSEMEGQNRETMGTAARLCFEKRFEITAVAQSLISTITPFLRARTGEGSRAL